MSYNWFIFRSVTILILGSLYLDIELLLITISFIFLHIKSGLATIIIDYIHDLRLTLFYNYLLQIILLENIRYLLEILC